MLHPLWGLIKNDPTVVQSEGFAHVGLEENLCFDNLQQKESI
jgi:hypothetical protein